MSKLVVKKVDGRSLRKRKPRDTNHPSYAVAKSNWADPEYRARMAECRKRESAARAADPERNWSRRGVPDGYTRETAAVMWAEAGRKAKLVVQRMIEKKIFDLSNMPADDAERAEAAMEASVKIMFSAINTEHRLRAARQILEFTKCKPEKKVNITTTEDWLASLASEMGPE